MLQCTLLYAQVSQLEQAKKALEERKPHDAYAIFQTIVESDPDNIEAHNGMAKSLDYTGDPQGALMAYNNSLNIQPNQPEVWLNIGNLYYTGKDLSNAANAYKKAIDLNPQFGRAYNNLATVYRDEENYPSAIEMFKNAVEADPDYARGYRNLGDIYTLIEDYKNAIYWLKKATSADPNNLFGWYWLGRAQLRSGEPEDAIQNFQRVIKILVRK